MAVAHVFDVGILGPVELVGGDSHPLLGEDILGNAGRIGVIENFANLLLDRLNFIFPGALSPGHTRLTVLVQDVEWHRRKPAVGVQGVGAYVSGGDAQDGDSCWSGYVALQPVKMGIDGSRLPSCVGENRVIDLWEEALSGEGKHGAGLDTGTK
ncbi:hypothetical protein GCM10010095_61180 [Streptomyces anthocyanicus]|nr:hypothetical protein GCM10010095_61180 [Streptomyces anthocyanicus]